MAWVGGRGGGKINHVQSIYFLEGMIFFVLPPNIEFCIFLSCILYHVFCICICICILYFVFVFVFQFTVFGWNVVQSKLCRQLWPPPSLPRLLHWHLWSLSGSHLKRSAIKHFAESPTFVALAFVVTETSWPSYGWGHELKLPKCKWV